MKTTLSTPQEISSRYIECYYTLYQKRVVKTRAEYCRMTDLLPQNFSTIEQGKRLASMAQICALVTNYSINPVWLMTGKGEMF